MDPNRRRQDPHEVLLDWSPQVSNLQLQRLAIPVQLVLVSLSEKEGKENRYLQVHNQSFGNRAPYK